MENFHDHDRDDPKAPEKYLGLQKKAVEEMRRQMRAQGYSKLQKLQQVVRESEEFTPEELLRLGARNSDDSAQSKADASNHIHQKLLREVLRLLQKELNEKIYKKMHRNSKKKARKAIDMWQLGESVVHLEKALKQIKKEA